MIVDYNGKRYSTENPCECSHCHKVGEPNLVIGVSHMGIHYSIWTCNWRECRLNFITRHDIMDEQLVFIGYLDGTPQSPFWPETIVSLKSKFIVTYLQSLKAENLNLDEIAGMGYRKSLEYLVKDYVISRDISLSSKIQNQKLSVVISNNFKSDKESDLKQLLERATWLGNDMTHYLKYHDNFNIDDLKQLIKLVVDEIHSITQKIYYIENIQSKYTKKSTNQP